MKVLEIVWDEEPIAHKLFKDAELTVTVIREDQTLAEGEFDIVFCAHVLQLVDRDKIFPLLADMVAHLREFGELWLITPSLEWACKEVLKNNITPPVLSTLFGGKQIHRMGFTLWALRDLLEQQGMIIRQAFQGPYTLTFGDQSIQVPQNTVIALKVTQEEDPAASLGDVA